MSKKPAKPPQIVISGLLEVIETRHRAPWLIRTPEGRAAAARLQKGLGKGSEVSEAEVQILEEIAFLCSYPPFLKDIAHFRHVLGKKLGIRLPVTSNKKAKESLKKIYFGARL